MCFLALSSPVYTIYMLALLFFLIKKHCSEIKIIEKLSFFIFYLYMKRITSSKQFKIKISNLLFKQKIDCQDKKDKSKNMIPFDAFIFKNKNSKYRKND